MEEEKNKQFSIMGDEKFMEFITDKFGKIHEDIDDIKTDLQNMESRMATKSFITDQIADLKGEFVIKMKKEDEKVEKMVDKLGEKKIFNPEDVKEIKSIKVFAKVA